MTATEANTFYRQFIGQRGGMFPDAISYEGHTFKKVQTVGTPAYQTPDGSIWMDGARAVRLIGERKAEIAEATTQETAA